MDKNGDFTQSDSKEFMGKNARYTAAGVLFSSFFGFLLYFAIGRFFGAGSVSDAFFAANIIWMMFLTFASTFRYTVSVMLAPLEKAEEFKALEGKVLTTVIFLIIPLCFIIYIYSYQLTGLLGAGFDAKRMDIARNLVKIMIPGFFFVCAGFVFSSSLGARGIFSIPALALASLNMTAFLIFLLLKDPLGIYAVAIGLTAGSVIFFLILLSAVTVKGIFPGLKLVSPRIFFKFMAVIFAGAGVYLFNQLNYWAIQSFSSFFREGIPSLFAYSATVTAFVIYIISFPISVVSAPSMARQRENVEKYFFGALRLNSIFSIPLAVMVFLFADSCAKILFAGSFSDLQIQILAGMIKLYIPVIIAGGVLLQFFSLFFSMDMKRHLFISGLLSIPVNLILLYLLEPYTGYYSLMLSQLGFTLFILAYLFTFMKSLKIKIKPLCMEIFQPNVVICAIFASVPVKVIMFLIGEKTDLPFLGEFLLISGGVLIYLVSFILLLRFLSRAKFEETAGMIKR